MGETLEQREENKTLEVIKAQVEGAFKDISVEDMEKTVIAYEPIWAIGTGKTATSQQAEEVHLYIRNLIVKMYNDSVAQAIRIQYGGSVKPENIVELMNQPNIDGALVGGASLKIDSFSEMIKLCA